MTDTLFAELSSVIQEEMTRQGVPGVAVGVWFEGQAYTAGFGVTNVDHPLPVDEETLAQIGSISKTMTATAVMRLVEKGLLDLDAPVRRYLPDLQLADEGVAAAVTLRHLLNHTGGWAGDYFSETGLGDDALIRYVEEMAELPQLTPLGDVWAYNNSAFSLAGRVIEAVTGQTYEQAMQELVFDPLGMARAFFFANDVITYGFVVGHSGRDAGPEPQVLRPWALARSAHSAGGVVTNVGELLRYARMHMGDGTAVDGVPFLRPATLQEMQTPRTAARLGKPVRHLLVHQGNRRHAPGISWRSHQRTAGLFPDGASARIRPVLPDQQRRRGACLCRGHEMGLEALSRSGGTGTAAASAFRRRAGGIHRRVSGAGGAPGAAAGRWGAGPARHAQRRLPG